MLRPSMSELSERLKHVEGRLTTFAKTVSLPQKLLEAAKLEARMSEADFWTDQLRAQRQVAELKTLKAVVDPYQTLFQGLKDAAELLEMAEGENDQDSIASVSADADRFVAQIDALELRLALGGRYDNSDVFLTIKPGAGGVEAMDWAGMLFRMYSNYLTRAGYTIEVVDMLPGEEAGVKTCVMAVRGSNAYGFLKAEMGTHRLVRMSPFNADGKRQTSFAAVEVTPEIDDVGEVVIDDKDLKVDTYRASGAGGQHVNKTDSAVRITHMPTGIVVSCQTDRSQMQNRSRCMKMLSAKILQMREVERLDELKDLKGERGTIGWGHQIRSYFLQPTQMVKDLRTGYQTSQAYTVLDGELQPFIDAYLRWVIAGRPDRRQQGKDEE